MVTLATWNLENLFRPGQEGGPDSDQEYRAKLKSLATTITSMNPDVLAVQEVGEPEALADLVGELDGQWHTELAEPDGGATGGSGHFAEAPRLHLVHEAAHVVLVGDERARLDARERLADVLVEVAERLGRPFR